MGVFSSIASVVNPVIGLPIAAGEALAGGGGGSTHNVLASEDGSQLTKGQSDAVRVKFGLPANVRANQFSPDQVQWGLTVNLNGVGHRNQTPDVDDIVDSGGGGGQVAPPSISQPSGPNPMSILTSLLLLKAISPPDPVAPPGAPPATPLNADVVSGADQLVNPGNTSGGLQSTILTDPVSRSRKNTSAVSRKKTSAIIDPIFGSSLTFGG